MAEQRVSETKVGETKVGETKNPGEALGSKQLSQRAAATRDLSIMGTPEVVPRLALMAQQDPSPAVRLGCAGAAADILSRYRVGTSRLALPDDERQRLFTLFKAIDPGVNPGLFGMLATLDTPECAPRILSGFRDPRGGVRVGAAVGLLRLCTSAAHDGDSVLEQLVVSALDDKRHKPDALAEVARVSAAAGYRSALPRLRSLGLEGAHGDTILAAVATLERAEDLSAWTGAWVSDGRDAGEVGEPGEQPSAFLIVAEGGGALFAPPGAPLRAEAQFDIEGARRMLLRRSGAAQAEPALQWRGATWTPADEVALVEVIDRTLRLEELDGRAPPAPSPEALLLLQRLGPVLSDNGLGRRTHALLELRAGQAEAALRSLKEAVELKKTPADAWYFLGELLFAGGDPTGAAEAWEATIRRARRKRDWFALRARAALGSEEGGESHEPS